MSDINYAVITGEVADSRKISQSKLGRIPDIIRRSIDRVNEVMESDGKLDFEIVRMDEFLCLSKNLQTALRSILMLASEFRSRAQNEIGIRSDLRLSMGIGPVELFQERLRESGGTAFRIADEALRYMKRNQRIMISTIHEEINQEFYVASGFMDILIHDWSDEQAEALFLSLSGMNQVAISEKLKISQPAVNRRLKAAHLEAIERLLERYNVLYSKQDLKI